MKTYRWGILATGNIAKKFATGLSTLPNAVIQSVGSRSQASAEAFGDTFSIPNRHGSYEALASDPEVDIIYVATPHPGHHQAVLLCLAHGKHVLCEKPIAINSNQTKEMIEKARSQHLFLMEAMWMRFLPVMVQVRTWLKEGLIGTVYQLSADFGFKAEWDPLNRKFNPELAGGALLDLGIYPISLAYMIFQDEPIHVSSTAMIGKTGVDNQSCYLLGYKNGAIAQLSTSFMAQTTMTAHIMGDKGMISIPIFWKAKEATVTLNGEEPRRYEFPYESTGLQCQATYVMECLEKGQTESEIMPWAETLRIMQLMDDMRAEWGVKYPGE